MFVNPFVRAPRANAAETLPPPYAGARRAPAGEANGPSRAAPSAPPSRRSRGGAANPASLTGTRGRGNAALLEPGRAEKRAKRIKKWTSAMGLAKIGAGSTILGFAGAGAYFVVSHIVALAHAGLSAKAGSILMFVGIGVGAGLLLFVLGMMAYKGVRQLHKQGVKDHEIERARRFNALQPQPFVG